MGSCFSRRDSDSPLPELEPICRGADDFDVKAEKERAHAEFLAKQKREHKTMWKGPVVATIYHWSGTKEAPYGTWRVDWHQTGRTMFTNDKYDAIGLMETMACTVPTDQMGR